MTGFQPQRETTSHFRRNGEATIQHTRKGDTRHTELLRSLGHRETKPGKNVITQDFTRMRGLCIRFIFATSVIAEIIKLDGFAVLEAKRDSPVAVHPQRALPRAEAMHAPAGNVELFRRRGMVQWLQLSSKSLGMIRLNARAVARFEEFPESRRVRRPH